MRTDVKDFVLIGAACPYSTGAMREIRAAASIDEGHWRVSKADWLASHESDRLKNRNFLKAFQITIIPIH
jgi:hypothetical protein